VDLTFTPATKEKTGRRGEREKRGKRRGRFYHFPLGRRHRRGRKKGKERKEGGERATDPCFALERGEVPSCPGKGRKEEKKKEKKKGVLKPTLIFFPFSAFRSENKRKERGGREDVVSSPRYHAGRKGRKSKNRITFSNSRPARPEGGEGGRKREEVERPPDTFLQHPISTYAFTNELLKGKTLSDVWYRREEKKKKKKG